MSKGLSGKKIAVLGLIGFGFLLWLLSRTVSPLMFPDPLEVAKVLLNKGFFALDLMLSVARAMAATVVVMVIGWFVMALFFFSEAVGSASRSVLGFLRSIPPIVFIPPVFLAIAEREYTARICLAAIGAFPVFMANVVAGLDAIPPSRMETVRLLARGDRRKMFRHVVMQEMIPHLVVGFRLAFAFSMVIVVVSEMVWGTQTPGIGTRVSDALSSSNTPEAGAIILLLGIVGALVNLILDWFEPKIIYWRQPRS